MKMHPMNPEDFGTLLFVALLWCPCWLNMGAAWALSSPSLTKTSSSSKHHAGLFYDRPVKESPSCLKTFERLKQRRRRVYYLLGLRIEAS